MAITLALEPQAEAKLFALAREKGMTADELLRSAVDGILSEAHEAVPPKDPTVSLRGLLSKYGSAPSANEIDESRAEMFANFPGNGF